MPARPRSPAEKAGTGRPARRPSPSAVDAALLVLATAVAFAPVFWNQFVNFDDPDVLVQNAQLGAPGVVRWAFSTTLIGHYQPLAWLVWSSTKSLFGLSPAAFHSLSLAVHLANGVLVYILTRRLAAAARLQPGPSRTAAIVAAFAFALHPTRVEPVAWASAAPYVFSLAMVLVSVIAYVDGRRVVSIVCYGAASLSRASAVGLPLVLLLLDFYPLDRRRHTGIGRLVLEKVPFAVIAAAATALEFLARDAASLHDVPLGARLTMAATAPFDYLGRTLIPVRLTPLDALPIDPAIDWLRLLMGLGGLLAVTTVAWITRRRWPVVIVGWLAYLVLLAPVAGLTQSGVQATADRYLYVPAVAISLVAGAAIAGMRGSGRRGMVHALSAAGVLLLIVFGTLTWRQTHYWNNSVSLWTRAIDLDPRNDVATYNLAIALAEDGQEGEAIRWYERTLALVPDQDLARQNLAILQAARAEREGNRLAEAGRVDEALTQYARALALDGKRVHARAAQGILLARRGEFPIAIVELRRALEDGVTDAEVSNVLAFALVQSGNDQEASAVLTKAVAAHPDNANLKRNLDLLSARMRVPKP